MKVNLLHFVAATVFTVMLPMSLPAQEIVMEEDFSKFAAGTQDQADETQIGNSEDDMYTTGLLDSYTILPGWQGYGVYQVGGTCVVKGIDYYGQPLVSLSTPVMNLPGNVKITVRARIYPGSQISTTPMHLSMRKGWTGNEEKSADITSEWKEVEWTAPFQGEWKLTVSAGDENSSMSEVPPLQIDYIRIENAGGKVELDAPVAKEATSVTETSFTANWRSVSGAESYLLYVESTKNGNTTLAVDGLEVPPASWGMPYAKVAGLDADAFHSYYVKAKAGDAISEASNKIDVVCMSTIEPTAATDVTADGFTANWKASPKAASYKVNVYRMTPTGRELIDTKTATENSCVFSGLKEDGAFWYAYDVTALGEFNGNEYESIASRRQAVSMNDGERKTERLLEEDFSLLTNGSEDDIYYKDYDPQDQGNEGPYVNLWSSQGGTIPDKYTHTPGWTGDGVGEAGGVAACSYMPYPSTYFGGSITTPKLSLGGLVTIKFRARAIPQYKPASADEPQIIPLYLSDSGNGNYDVVSFSDGIIQTVEEYTERDGSVWRDESLQVKLTDNEWHDYSLTYLNYFQGETKLSFGNGSNNYAAFFIDDITVDLGLTSLPVPQSEPATDFTADGFTANWQAVEKADDYLLSVYRRKAGKNDYAYTDLPVEGTSYVVTGLDPKSDYIYTVKARSGVVVSGESRPVSAMGISTPVLLPATDLTESSFTTNWERTPKATRYTLNVFAGTSAEGQAVVTEEIEDGDVTSFAVTGLDTESEKKFCYQLIAFYDTSSDTYESLPSEPMTVDLEGGGVNAVEAGAVKIEKAGNAVRIVVDTPSRVLIATVDGKTVKSGIIPAGESTVNVAPGALYIIKVAGKTTKLTF